MGKIVFYLLVFIMGVATLVYGQKADRKAALSSVNESIRGQVELTLKGKIIEMRLLDEEGKNRKDRVNYLDLDVKTLDYDQNNSMIIVNCYEGDCVERVLFKQKLKRYYKRLCIPVKLDDDQIEKVISQFGNLIEY